MGDVMILAVPPLLLGVLWWSRAHGAAWSTVCLRGLLGVSVVWIVSRTLFPLVTDLGQWGLGSIHLRTNAVPLRSIWNEVPGLFEPTVARSVIRQLGGNIVLFVPFGFLLPVAIPRCRNLGATVMVGLLLSAIIESIQLVEPFHSTDVDDVLLNVLGTAIGYGVYAAGSVVIARAGRAGEPRELPPPSVGAPVPIGLGRVGRGLGFALIGALVGALTGVLLAGSLVAMTVCRSGGSAGDYGETCGMAAAVFTAVGIFLGLVVGLAVGVYQGLRGRRPDRRG